MRKTEEERDAELTLLALLKKMELELLKMKVKLLKMKVKLLKMKVKLLKMKMKVELMTKMGIKSGRIVELDDELGWPLSAPFPPP